MSSHSFGEELTGIVPSERSVASLQDQVAQLFEQARDDVYRYLLILGLHPPQAQEATQEVFLRLYMTLKKGSDIDSPRAWIFRVAHNLGLKVRAQQDSQPAFDPDLEGQIPSPHRNPEQDYLERERLLWFHEAIGGLSDQQRRCLHLRLEGLRYPEIAAILGISTSAVGEFLRRALVRLRKAGHA